MAAILLATVPRYVQRSSQSFLYNSHVKKIERLCKSSSNEAKAYSLTPRRWYFFQALGSNLFWMCRGQLLSLVLVSRLKQHGLTISSYLVFRSSSASLWLRACYPLQHCGFIRAPSNFRSYFHPHKYRNGCSPGLIFMFMGKFPTGC